MPVDPEDLLREAEDEIEAWLCELDGTWRATLHGAEARATHLVTQAEADAAEIVAVARVEADVMLTDARDEVERLHETAGEHADVIRALTAAERLQAGDQLTGLREAVDRLRTELSRVVDAAFDALPAVEATAGAIDAVLGEVPPVEEQVLEEQVIDLTASDEKIDLDDAFDPATDDIVPDDDIALHHPRELLLVGVGAPTMAPKPGRLRRMFRRGR